MNNGTTFDKRILWLLSVIVIVFSAWYGIDARISASVRSEMTERKEADAEIERRFERSLDKINQELAELNRYLRDELD